MTLFLFAMAVALVPVPQCFYWLRLLPYLWQFSGCDTMRFFFRHDPLAAIICHACYPLCSIGALDAIKFAVPVAFFVAFQCRFPIFFAAIARGPLAFATRRIWAADYNLALSWLTFSRQTAAVRAPLCLRFPLLLGSVQAGVGLLSPPPHPGTAGSWFPIFFCRYRSRSLSFRYPLDLSRGHR